MATLKDIIRFLDTEFLASRFDDSSLNGVQIGGGSMEVKKIAVAVDAGQSVIERAALAGASLLFVHHGLYWGAPRAITGVHASIIRSCFDHALTLYAMHLPLDAHQRLGNNFLLGKLLSLSKGEAAAEYGGQKIGFKGENDKGLTLAAMAELLMTLAGGPTPAPVLLPFGPEVPKHVCIVSGSAGDLLPSFEKEGFDTLITGEPRQSMYHFAKENGLNALCAGHYRTETIGVRAVGEELAGRFGVEQIFIDEPTGI